MGADDYTVVKREETVDFMEQYPGFGEMRSFTDPLDDEQVGFHHERDAEHRLEVGFVPTGERAPAISGLHLGRRDDLFVAVGVTERAAIEAAQPVVEYPGERDFDGVLAAHDVARRADEQIGRASCRERVL